MFIMGQYKAAYAPDHPRRLENNCIYEHVLVAEEKLGRYLKDGEVVHHRDLNKYNNDPYNIIVFCSKSEHTKFHKYGCDESILIQLEDGSYKCDPNIVKGSNVCPICGNKKDKKANICKGCYDRYKNRKVINRPTRNELKYKIRNYSFVDIGREYGVNDNSIRKWCKAYNLPYRTKDIKLISNEEWELI